MMRDNLRDRIATALFTAATEGTWRVAEMNQDDAELMADAVIRELHLSTVIAPLGITIVTGVLPTWEADNE